MIFRRQIGSLYKIENEILLEGDSVRLEMEADLDFYSFYYLLPNGERTFLGKGETIYITTEVGGSFTGNYIALYALGNSKKCEAEAHFTNFDYIEKE